MEPVAPRSHNTMPMLDQFRSNHPETSKIEGVSSLDTALKVFWNNQREQLGNFAGQTHLPLSRVRKILKSDPEVKVCEVNLNYVGWSRVSEIAIMIKFVSLLSFTVRMF
jgi:hypothetical protein